MALPLNYNVRNVLVRWRSTLATVSGIALVVAVYVVMQAMAAGLEKSRSNTGDPRNVMIVRKGSTAESSSQVSLEQFKLVQFLPQIARDAQGRPLASGEVMVLINLPRRDDTGEANVLLRGITPLGMQLRPQVRLVEGRWFTPGVREAVVSRRLAKRFAHFELGGRITSGGKQLSVVGIMDGANSAFDSEIWMDADEARSLFDRDHYSSVLVRAASADAIPELVKRIDADKRLPLRADMEVDYYAAQTNTAVPIRILGQFLAMAMSIGAIFAAMNTMYASVGARTREIGTLRVLGFRRRSILFSFLVEGALLALVGGMIGCALAFQIHGYTTGTLGFETFSEIVYQFRITPGIVARGLGFAVTMGIVGSFIPAVRASRLPVIAALKAV